MKVTNCNIKIFNAVGAWFEEGLEVKNCVFISEVTFEAGGHNTIQPILIENNVFNCFVDFFDAHYNGPFIFTNNLVLKGSNLLANSDKPYKTIFAAGSKIESNIGTLNIEGPDD
ncbi:hypothetical protein [Mucilaginibacter panaciglaebae]|uniref:Uncharacterized protein n=1 Tax=Mucilaginibacter panaciglaebae TaxID=502331 RepID=A0ABP7X714_9SPHI